MQTLANAAQGVAAGVLRRLKYDERLALVWQDGESDITESLYTFEEVVNFLGMDVNRIAGRPGRPSSVDFGALKEWVENVIGDKELARAIAEVTGKAGDLAGPDKREMIGAVKDLMQARLSQCRQIQLEVTRRELERNSAAHSLDRAV